MAKIPTMYKCSACGFRTPTFQGKCPNCGEWNTLKQVASDKLKVTSGSPSTPVDLGSLSVDSRLRIKSEIGEFDDVLGGGLVPGSLVLLGGDPGIGKSTLALQISMKVSSQTILYVSGEESAGQIKLRASRINKNHQLQVLAETDLETVLATVLEVKPDLVIVDSIQTMYSQEATGVAGGVAQVTNAVQKVMQVAKQNNIAFLKSMSTLDLTVAPDSVKEFVVEEKDIDLFIKKVNILLCDEEIRKFLGGQLLEQVKNYDKEIILNMFITHILK
jgi:DNA repair protein RadA/Sms